MNVRLAVRGRKLTSGHTLSVVIPVYNVEDYLPECLDSLLAQTLEGIEIIIVDDGSTDSCPQIIAEYASRHSQIHAYRQDNAGQGAARNLGVRHSTGRYLTFLDADDTVPVTAYKFMVDSLVSTGSDFSVGSVRRVKNDRLTNPFWVQLVHSQDRIGIAIDDFPDALQDVIACNRMFRRKFWVEKVRGFPEGTAYEDHVPMVVAYVRAEKFDVLQRVTYRWRLRENKSSTSQKKRELQNLKDRVAVKAEAQAILQREASENVYGAWLGRVLDTDFPLFITHARSNGGTYQDTLQTALRKYVDLATPEALRQVRVQEKLRTWLASRGLWDQVMLVEQYFRDFGSLPPTKVVDGHVYADLAIRTALTPETPAELFELGASETALDARLQRAVWTADGSLQVTGWAFIKAVDLSDEAPSIRGWLQGREPGQREELPVESLILPEATWSSGASNANYDRSGFKMTVDTGRLAKGRWVLHVEVEAKGLSRCGTVHRAVPGSSATKQGLASAKVHDSGEWARPAWDAFDGFVLELFDPAVVATSLTCDPVERTAAGTLRLAPAVVVSPRRVIATDKVGERKVEAPLGGMDDEFEFSLCLPASSELAQMTWKVRVDGGADETHPIYSAEHPDDLAGPPAEPENPSLYWDRGNDSILTISTDRPVFRVSGISVGRQFLAVTVLYRGLDKTERASAVLTDDRVEIPVAHVDDVADGVCVLRFPTRISYFRGPDLPLGQGHYWISLAARPGLNADATAEYISKTPIESRNDLFRTRLTYAKAHEARVSVLPPFSDHEYGKWAQRQLKTTYQQAVHTPEDSVLFQCYRGEFASDSQLAIHEHLRTERPDLTLYWGVADLATPLPGGGRPLVIGSESWYEKLGSARFLCNNVDFDSFFRRQPHQRYLQTFHGYPFKSMGRTFWRGKGYTPERIGTETRRRNAEWDAIVVPSQPCADMYRQEYDFDGEILVTGYPRCDALVNTDRSVHRPEILARLGVDPAKTVVLYAPTYRESLTTRVFAAKRFDELDLEFLTEAIGDEFVVLVRGHNNNQREPDRVRGKARVVDVTDYPDINDLTIAADVAVLDYSSLRFDWALTRKPMIFFVPDLATYFDERPPLFDFESSAPGPLVVKSADVASRLLDLDGVSSDFVGQIDEFNDRFNRLNDGHATERVVDAFFRD